MKPIVPCLWFDTQAEEAARFYASIFPKSKIGDIQHYGENMHLPAGTVLTVRFEINGQEFLALNGGPIFPHTEAVSFMVSCDSQEEIDSYWEKLIAGGGRPVECGWLKDRYGLSWQIIPSDYDELMRKGTPRQIQAYMDAVMKMVKLDAATLRQAWEQAG